MVGLLMYRTRAIITRGLYTFYPLFEVHLPYARHYKTRLVYFYDGARTVCTVTFGLMYG